ncbi:YaiI/YqxD family protein [Paenibacillaceae bacterium T2]|uniref:UPF0178 protein VF724_03300 n=1 Tax=Ferviditalea candida TaxID=3108399 RepID=A0ABU5ZHU9_9BACL|nr:YaiI/YqxD family protein [Paenibacillaceae bacterium T2]
MSSEELTIIVDADACPVKKEIVLTAKAFRVPVAMVASYDHRLQPEEGVRIVQVDRSQQSADLFIANLVKAHDILVTQDFGLAAIGLAKGAVVLSNRGQIYNNENIGFLLERRHEHAKQRRNGHYGKGPKPFTEEDRVNFLHTLTKTLEHLQENSSL